MIITLDVEPNPGNVAIDAATIQAVQWDGFKRVTVCLPNNRDLVATYVTDQAAHDAYGDFMLRWEQWKKQDARPMVRLNMGESTAVELETFAKSCVGVVPGNWPAQMGKVVESIRNDNRLEILAAALNRIASWGEGKEVTSAFDEPSAASVARVALDETGLFDVPRPQPKEAK